MTEQEIRTLCRDWKKVIRLRISDVLAMFFMAMTLGSIVFLLFLI
jgi:hypothetical protein